MTAGEVCNRQVVIARSRDTVIEAARRMRELNVGDVVVVEDVDGCRPIGILTDRDIVVNAVGRTGADLTHLLVGDIMSAPVVTVREEEDWAAALVTMRARKIRRLPVVNRSGTLEGILTFDDVVQRIMDELGDLAKVLEQAEPLVGSAWGRERELSRPRQFDS